MANVKFSDFIPPIFGKIKNKLVKNKRLYPFMYLPGSINPGWILDIGANIGDVADAALKTFNNSGIICFEPVKSTFELLKNKLQEFKDRVYLYNMGLSDTTGDCEIHITSFHGANSIEPQAALHKLFNPNVKEISTETIKVVCLDEIAHDFPVKKIDIMKIDVEGHELKVLNGGKNFIRQNVDTIIIEIAIQRETSFENQSFTDIFNLLKSWGFCLINIYDVYNSTYLTNKNDIMLTQMDCVFRHKKYIKVS